MQVDRVKDAYAKLTRESITVLSLAFTIHRVDTVAWGSLSTSDIRRLLRVEKLPDHRTYRPRTFHSDRRTSRSVIALHRSIILAGVVCTARETNRFGRWRRRGALAEKGGRSIGTKTAISCEKRDKGIKGPRKSKTGLP